MKSLVDFIKEAEANDSVWTVYSEDGTVLNVFNDEADAKKAASEYEGSVEGNKATIKKEPKSTVEK